MLKSQIKVTVALALASILQTLTQLSLVFFSSRVTFTAHMPKMPAGSEKLYPE